MLCQQSKEKKFYTFIMSFGENLRFLMVEQHISQTEFAKKIGYAQRTISSWVNSQSEPTESAIRKVAEYFQISTDELLDVDKNYTRGLNTYSAEERQLVADFRQLSYYKRELIKNNIIAMLPVEVESTQKKKE